MSGVFKTLYRGSKSIGDFFLGSYGYSGTLKKVPGPPDVPKPPSIDDAQKNQNETDRLKHRRGVLANIFAGGSSSGAGAQKTLLGQ